MDSSLLARDVVSAVVNGLTSGAVYAAVAIPFVLVARASGIFNFAYATTVIFVGVGAGHTIAGSDGAAQRLALAVLWIIIGAALGTATYLVAVAKVERPSGTAGSHLTLVTTLSVGLILATVAYRLWGATPPAIPNPIGGEWHVFSDVYVTYFSLIFLAAVVALGFFGERWLKRSGWGTLWRAMGEDRMLAESRGINSLMWSMAIFAVGGAMSAFAGLGLAVQTPQTPFTGLTVALNAFLVLGIVGIDSLWAAVAGGLLLGVMGGLIRIGVGSSMRDVLVIVLIAVVLAIAPKGLFGRRGLREV